MAIRDAGRSGVDDHHTQWVRRFGVGEESGSAREHGLISMVLRLGTTFVQLDMPNVTCSENLGRRMVQIVEAVRRIPRQPDYDRLDCILDSSLDAIGGVVPPRSTQYISEVQRQEAQILKASRQWREETTTANKKKKGREGGGKGD